MFPSKIKCRVCNKEKPKKEYYKHGGYNFKKCKKCVAKTNKEKHLELKRKKENGIIRCFK